MYLSTHREKLWILPGPVVVGEALKQKRKNNTTLIKWIANGNLATKFYEFWIMRNFKSVLNNGYYANIINNPIIKTKCAQIYKNTLVDALLGFYIKCQNLSSNTLKNSSRNS